MATSRPVSAVVYRLQTSKFIGAAVGSLLGLSAFFGYFAGRFAGGPSDVDAVVLLITVGLGLAVVVSLETVYAAVRLADTPDSSVETIRIDCRLVRIAEMLVAICVLAGVVLWQLGVLGDISARQNNPPTGLSVVAAGMVAVSFVRSITVLWEKETTPDRTSDP